MRDDRLFLEIDTRWGPLTLDGNVNLEQPMAHRACKHSDFTADVGLGQCCFFNMAAESLEDTLTVAKKIMEMQLKKPARCVLLCKVSTTSPLWKFIVSHAKDIFFLQGRVEEGVYRTALALVIFYGEVKGSPMVFTLDVDALEAPPVEFNRRRLLFMRAQETNRYPSSPR